MTLTLAQLEKFLTDTKLYDSVPSLTIEELPPYLVHRNVKIRRRARFRLQQLRIQQLQHQCREYREKLQ